MSPVTRTAGALSVLFLLACMGGEAPVAPAPAPAPAPSATAPEPAAEPAADGEDAGDGEGDADAEGEEGEEGADGEADGEGGEAEGEGGAEGDGEQWCCEYDGPLGKTHALIDNPEECSQKFGDNGAEFVKGPQCEPVCCKYAKDPADLGKGYLHEVVASANCTMRKGEVAENACQTAKPSAPATRPTGGRLVRPGTGPRPEGGTRPASPVQPGRRLTRPGG